MVEGESGRGVIIDFGLGFETSVTEALFQPAGTPLFMSPEQIMGKKPTASSDRFSFALVAFQLLTGQHPFAGQSLEELAEQIRASRIRATPQTTQLSRAGKAVFERALAPSPDERFGSVQEFYDQLPEAEPRARVTAKHSGFAGVNLPDRTSNKSLAAAA